MAGFKNFADGNVLTGDELDGYLMRQAVPRFPTTSDLTANLTVGIREVGMMAFADDVDVTYMWDGTNWVPWLSVEKTASVAFTAGSNVTVGNSVVKSVWRYAGGMVKFDWSFTVGSTANMQSGNLALGLPISGHADFIYSPAGNATFFDASAPTVFRAFTACFLGTQGSIGFVVESGTRWSTASPTAFGAGDILACNLLYRPTAGALL